MADRERIRRALSGGAIIAVSIAVMNVATYGFTIAAARVLGPQSYGAVAALMNLMLVLTVMQLALQAVAARRISANLDHAGEVEVTMLRVGWQATLWLGGLAILLSPLVNLTLRLHSLPTAALVGLAMAPLTLIGAQTGVLQGERRWTPLALIYLTMGLGRLAFGVGAIVWHPTEFAGMLGITIGAFVPAIVGELAIRRARHARDEKAHSGEHGLRPVWRETFHNGQALLAFFALSNADLLVARNTLGAHEAGLYAGGLIVVKAGLFLPQFVVVLAFPSMSSETARRGVLVKSLSAVAGIGVITAIGAAALPSLALVFVGGSQYAPIEGKLWAFAIVGTVLSMLQLLVYSVLAQQARRSVLLIWAALLILVVGGQFVHTFTELLVLVLGIDTALFVVLLLVSLARVERRRPSTSLDPVSRPEQSPHPL